MGHKRHRVIRGDFSNVNPGRGGPGITEDGYPPHLVAVSVQHPEINPKGVTVESFTEEVSEEQIFGTNVGEAIEEFINNEETNNPNEEDTTMNTNNNAKETTNNPNKETETMNSNTNVKQENTNMNNEQAKVNQDGTIDDGSNTNTNNINQKPSLAKEAASAFVVGAAYGAGTITAVIGISLLAAGIRKLCSGDASTATDAAETTETVETVAEAFLR